MFIHIDAMPCGARNDVYTAPHDTVRHRTQRTASDVKDAYFISCPRQLTVVVRTWKLAMCHTLFSRPLQLTKLEKSRGGSKGRGKGATTPPPVRGLAPTAPK